MNGAVATAVHKANAATGHGGGGGHGGGSGHDEHDFSEIVIHQVCAGEGGSRET